MIQSTNLIKYNNDVIDKIMQYNFLKHKNQQKNNKRETIIIILYVCLKSETDGVKIYFKINYSNLASIGR